MKFSLLLAAPAVRVVLAAAAVPDGYPSVNGFFDTLGPQQCDTVIAVPCVQGSAGVFARGWAYEPALNGAASTVQIFANGTFVQAVQANEPRPDIVPHGAPDANHGFSVDVSQVCSAGNTRIDVFVAQNGGQGTLWSVNNSPRRSDGTWNGLPVPQGLQGMDDETVTAALEAAGDAATLDVRYQIVNQQLQPGVRRYNLFWSALEPSTSPLPGGADPGVACPVGQQRVPLNESDRVARGYRNYHCYDVGIMLSFDDMLARDAGIGALSAVIAYASPPYAMLPNCTGFPWGQQMYRYGCYPWNNLDDWEDYINFIAERWSAPPGSGRARVSAYVIWNEVQSAGWGDPSPVLPNRFSGSNYTDAQMQTLVGVYAAMLRRADAAVRRHARGVSLWVSFDHFMSPPPLATGDVMHVGGTAFLQALWPMINQTLDWGIAVHPYDDGDPRHDLSAQGIFTFATLQRMVADAQCAFLTSVARVPPQGCAAQPQTAMFASEQGWPFNNVTMNDTLRARNVCFAHALSAAQGVWAVTHNFFQADAGGEVQNGAYFNLIPWPPTISANLTNGVGYPTYDAYVATSPRVWGATNDNYCCVHWNVGCAA